MSHLLLMLRFIRFNYSKIINAPWNSLTKASLNCFQCNKLDSMETLQRLLNQSTEQGNTTNQNLLKVRVTEWWSYGSVTEIKREKRKTANEWNEKDHCAMCSAVETRMSSNGTSSEQIQTCQEFILLCVSFNQRTSFSTLFYQFFEWNSLYSARK